MKLTKQLLIAFSMIIAICMTTASTQAQSDNPFDKFITQLNDLSNQHYILQKKGLDFEAPELMKLRKQAIGLQNMILSQNPDPVTMVKAIYGGVEFDLMQWDRLVQLKLLSSDFLAKFSAASGIIKQLEARNIDLENVLEDIASGLNPSLYQVAGMDDGGTIKTILINSPFSNEELIRLQRTVAITVLISLEHSEESKAPRVRYFNSQMAMNRFDLTLVKERNRWVITDIRVNSQSKSEKQILIETAQRGAAALKRGRR